MKIYHTETQADYDVLMIELEEQGYLWASGHKPTEVSMRRSWSFYEKNTRITANLEKELEFGSVVCHKEKYPDIPIIKYKAKQEGHTMTPEQEREYSEANSVNKPSYYQDKNGKDLYQKWYEEHGLEKFRSIALRIADQYIDRYKRKNDVKDLTKGIYALERLKKYEDMAK